MVLKNLMEEIVWRALDNLAIAPDFCGCPNCRLDAAALALNMLPPRYVVSDKGDSYGRAGLLELQKEVDVVRTVLTALKAVRQSPRHCISGGP